MHFKISKDAYIATEEIKVEDVAKTYNGKARTCCCGCAGKYAYSVEHGTIENAKTQEKYGKDFYDIRPRSLKNTVNKINSAIRGEVEVDSVMWGKTFISIEIGDRMYTAYFEA